MDTPRNSTSEGLRTNSGISFTILLNMYKDRNIQNTVSSAGMNHHRPMSQRRVQCVNVVWKTA